MQHPNLKTPDDFVADGHTPMMAQYLSVKQAHPGMLLFYRMGDFYELFFEDAEIASRVLDITLTRRGKTQGDDIPMCGVPFHAYEPYLARLIRAGHRVAICDQIETPEDAKARGGAKALVRRDVVRVVTPGTLTEDTLLDARTANYLAALTQARGELGLAWLDLSTGEFKVEAVEVPLLAATLARLHPSEILTSERLYNDAALRPALDPFARILTLQAAPLFDPENARQRLLHHFGIGTLDAFGSFTLAEQAAAGALLDYTERTQKAAVSHIRPPRHVDGQSLLLIDPATRRNLELTETMKGERTGTLLSTIDRTISAAGARLLHARLAAPSRDLTEITARHDQIDALLSDNRLRQDLRARMADVPDLERACSRLALGRAGARDLAAVRDALKAALHLTPLLSQGAQAPKALASLCADLTLTPDLDNILETLHAALAEDLPALLSDGNFIRPGYDPALDQQRSLRDDGRRTIVQMQQTHANDTGVDGLKIAHNNILGYYIEVSAKRADPLFAKPETYIHRQTMANAVRFTTVPLSNLERDLMQAASRALALEMDMFRQLSATVLAAQDALNRLASALAALDVACGLAELAATEAYVRPTLTEDSDFVIADGRHPVVEAALKQQGTAFIANDADLSASQNLWLLTGPNMAGKSTFLRQNALIIILAQMGSFVPARAATIGLVDRLFSRVGAADDLAQGRSTFMVEMVETAAILHQATEKSFVILDEIGRGTATFDGLSIAWATLEYLHDTIGARGLFATHYHELTHLCARLSRLYAATVDVREWQGEIVFLHQVKPGAAAASYGIHVARLAGLPGDVITRAQAILHMLEKGEESGAITRLADDLPLFSAHVAATPPLPPAKPSALEEKLKGTDIDALSPREALDLLYTLKSLI